MVTNADGLGFPAKDAILLNLSDAWKLVSIMFLSPSFNLEIISGNLWYD